MIAYQSIKHLNKLIKSNLRTISTINQINPIKTLNKSLFPNISSHFFSTSQSQTRTSNYSIYREKQTKDLLKQQKLEKKQAKTDESQSFSLPGSTTPKEDYFKRTDRINSTENTESKLNDIDLRPYFENIVDKKELSYDTFTQPTNVEQRLTKFPISKKEMIKRAVRIKRVKIIRDHIKRQLDDKTL